MRFSASTVRPISIVKPVTISTADKPPAVDFDRLRPRIDAALTRYSQFDENCPGHLAEAIQYALLSHGKRLRPQLVLMATEACGGSIDVAMPADKRDAVLQRLAAAKPDAVAGLAVTSVDTIDGFRFSFGDKGWLLYRLSGTEPLVRIYTEVVGDQALVQRILDEGREIAGV